MTYRGTSAFPCALAAVLLLSGCNTTTKLDAQDRALLEQTQAMAQQARDSAAASAAAAERAAQDAAAARAAAVEAEQKSLRIFEHGGDK
jgi:hypothetical protein